MSHNGPPSGAAIVDPRIPERQLFASGSHTKDQDGYVGKNFFALVVLQNPVLGKNYLEFESFFPKTELRPSKSRTRTCITVRELLFAFL